MRGLIVYVILLIYGCAYAGTEPPKIRVSEEEPKEKLLSFYLFYDEAVQSAEKQKKNLVIWVGVKPTEHKDVAIELSKEAVHAFLPEFNKSKLPRLVVVGGDGKNRYINAKELGSDTPERIRNIWKLR